jgi:uncharacterized membrane protein YphA (DoxX/SURF4 family)
MSVFAALLSIVLCLAFTMAGAQKILFNPVMSKSAERLSFTKRGYRRIGVLELIGALGVIVGVVAHGTSFLGVLNELAAIGLALMMSLAVYLHLRRGDSAKLFSPALVLGFLALLELIFRLS